MDPLWILLVGVVVVVGGVLVLRLHAFLALLLGALAVGGLTPAASIRTFALDRGMSAQAAQDLSAQTVGERVANGFGSTCGKIGILIAMASIIGKCLLDSGAADRIVRSTLRLLGERGAPVAFLSSGFLLAVPVFFDTVFYLMIPLGKAMRMRTGRNYLLYVLTITAGATMAHSLVPPTPGPLFVASELKVDVGTMILAGGFVGFFCALYGLVHALVVNRIMDVPLRESAEISLADLQALAQRDERQLPPLGLSLLPIVLPVVLIAGNTVLAMTEQGVSSHAGLRDLVWLMSVLGNKNIALILSAAVALATLVWQTRASRQELATAVQSALASGGIIILITSAGGAFGGVLQQTGIGARIEQLAQHYQIAVLPLAFLVTALVRTAQGSATVAMITAVGILAGMADAVQLGFHPVYIALAIGCGSKPITWMNDSGFWVICKMSGMTEAETLKSVTPMTTIMGLIGLLVTMLCATFLPMVPPGS